jgi:cysteine desulfurase/selenocysteine lyase
MRAAKIRPDRADRVQPVDGGWLGPGHIRGLFPALGQQVNGHPLVYLDNAATTQKPRSVIEALVRYYETDNANVHRGAHALADRATAAYEGARATVARFLNARSPEEIVFVRGATEAINLVADSFGRRNVGPGDEVLITEMEHHANLVPWQQLCLETGARLRVLPITDRGELALDVLEGLLSDRTRLVALTHVSNALGTVNPIRNVVEAARRLGIPVLVDGAQAVPHFEVDVQALDCDFYAFSGHKVYGPMGIGVLYGRLSLLEEMPPWQCGGDMVHRVEYARTTFNDPPYRFEAGTPNVAGAVGLAAALEFLEDVGRSQAVEHESHLLELATRRLDEIPGVRIVGGPAHRVGVVSFVVDEPPFSALDLAVRLDGAGIAVRAGHHCCQPLMRRLGVTGTIRASVAVYNTEEDVERLAFAVRSIVGGASKSSTAAPAGWQQDTRAVFYPGPTAATVEEAAEALLVELDPLEDWSERYEFLIELGSKAPPLADWLKTEANRVRGCQSTVYLAARAAPGTRDSVEFLADSDSGLVRGLLAMLQQLFSGQRAGDILRFDLPGFLVRAGLESNLTLGRRNGLAEMVKRLRKVAAGLDSTAGVRPQGSSPAAKSR